MPRANYQLALIHWDDNNGPIPRGIPAAPPAPDRRFKEVLSDADVSGSAGAMLDQRRRGAARFVLPPRAAGFADHSESCKARWRSLPHVCECRPSRGLL